MTCRAACCLANYSRGVADGSAALYRIAGLRADGLHVTPDGSPGFPRWKVTQETAPGVVVCVGYATTEAAAVALAEGTPL